MDVATFDGQFCFSYDGQIDCHCKFQWVYISSWSSHLPFCDALHTSD
jgi:hypothetical protein